MWFNPLTIDYNGFYGLMFFYHRNHGVSSPMCFFPTGWLILIGSLTIQQPIGT